MTLTTPDPDTAPVVIGLQQGILAASTVHPRPDVIRQSAALCAAFRRHDLPVVTAAGRPSVRTEAARPRIGPTPGWTDLVAELDRLPQDLRGRGTTQLVIAGVATRNGVEATARHARAPGFNVGVATADVTEPLDARIARP